MPFFLYVHPNSGPISPMAIDLDAVKAVGDSSPGRSTAEMAKYVAAQVDNRFQRARAHENMRAFEAIVPHMNPLSGAFITGIAVRVPGEIPAAPLTPEAANQLAELEQAVSSLKAGLAAETNKLKIEQEAHHKTYQELARLRASMGRGPSSELVEQLKARCAELEKTLKRTTDRSEDAVKKAREAAEAAERERGKEQLRAEQAERARDAMQTERDAAKSRADALVEERNDFKSQLNSSKNTWDNDKKTFKEQIRELERKLETLRRQQVFGQPGQLDHMEQPQAQPSRVRVTLAAEPAG